MEAGAPSSSSSAAAAVCQEPSDSKTIVAAFPNEVFEAIFDHLSPVELARLSQSSRSLYRIATSSNLWERAYLSFWREGDEKRELARESTKWRQRKRYAEYKEVAKRAWLADGKTANDGGNHSKRRRRDRTTTTVNQDGITPFPYFLSSAVASTSETFNPFLQTPDFYKLFLERIQIDDQVLQEINIQCTEGNDWLKRVESIVDKYGNDAKDVLHALVNCQTKRQHNLSVADLTLSDSKEEERAIFPTALQVRLPSTRRSSTHHLSLLHYGRELLEHLQYREAVRGFMYLQSSQALPSYSSHWIHIQGQGQEDVDVKALVAAQKCKAVENALCWLAMFRGGEGQEIAQEFDVLAITCTLYLASNNITLQDDTLAIAAGIYRFLKSRSFKGASPSEYKNLDNNFLHFSLDQWGRETLPLTLVVIFCAIASRLGLAALPTNTPAHVLAVVENITSSSIATSDAQPPSDNRLWVDIYNDGHILETDDVGTMLSRLRLPLEERFIAPTDHISMCLRSSANIINSVQQAQRAPRFYTIPPRRVDDDTRGPEPFQTYSDNIVQKADEVFENIIMAPDSLFNPRRTYMDKDDELYLVSTFWSNSTRDYYKGRYLRAKKWSDFDQQSAMHAASNALTRLGDELGDRGIDWCVSLTQTYFPLDTLVMKDELINESYASPLYVQDEAARLSISTIFTNLRQEDQEGPTPTTRILPNHSHIYPIGTLFVHRSYGYKAVIIGWNEKCNAPQSWMTAMGVDELPNGGRMQPFYQSAVEDGSTRYVAHFNVLPASELAPNSSNIRSTIGMTIDSIYGSVTLENAEEVIRQRGIGKLFRCLTYKDGHLQLMKSKHGKQAFPDD